VSRPRAVARALVLASVVGLGGLAGLAGCRAERALPDVLAATV
jgi:hypothetical protein